MVNFNYKYPKTAAVHCILHTSDFVRISKYVKWSILPPSPPPPQKKNVSMNAYHRNLRCPQPNALFMFHVNRLNVSISENVNQIRLLSHL